MKGSKAEMLKVTRNDAPKIGLFFFKAVLSLPFSQTPPPLPLGAVLHSDSTRGARKCARKPKASQGRLAHGLGRAWAHKARGNE